MSLKKSKKIFPMDGSEIPALESTVEYEKMQREENRDILAYIFWIVYVLAFVGIIFMVVDSYNSAVAP